MNLITINACAYCGRRAQGNYTIHRDGVLNGDAGNPQVPLCDACGSQSTPSLQDIWLRISLRDDDGDEWGPTVGPCAARPLLEVR